MRSIPIRKAPDLDAAELTGEQEPTTRSSASAGAVNLCARVPADLRDRVKVRAVQEHRSVQDLVVQAVARYLDDGE